MHIDLTVRNHPLRSFVCFLAIGVVPLSLVYFCGVGINTEYDDTFIGGPVFAVLWAVGGLALIAWLTRAQVRFGPILEIGPDGIRVAHWRRGSAPTRFELSWDHIERIEVSGFGPFRRIWFVESAGRGADGGPSLSGRYGHLFWLGDRSEAEILAAMRPYTDETEGP